MKLALGTVQFGVNYGVANTTGRVGCEGASVILQQARESGIDMLDTAVGYGDSEAILGQANVTSWNVVTKLPAVPENCQDIKQWVRDQTVGSLQRLGVRQLHGLLIHRPNQLLGVFGRRLYEALQMIKDEGYAKKIGISVYAPAELEPLFTEYSFDLVQAPLNILDRRLIDSGWATQLKKAGVEIHVRSVFLQGLLLMPEGQRPAKFDPWAHIWDEWGRWLAQTGLTAVQACLRYAISQKEIDRVIVGVDGVKHLDEIIQSAQGVLPSFPAFDLLQDERLVNPATWGQL